MKICPTCKKEYGDESTFCTGCGGKLSDQHAHALAASAINLGDKNVISGEVIGHKEDIRVSGNATIVKNEDQTREVKACGFCGKTKLILDGVFCRRCGAFVCEEHFERTTNQCLKCQRGMSSEAEQKYMTLLQEVMSDNRIDAQERQRLDEERKRLNLSEDRVRELESIYKGRSGRIDALDRRARMQLDIARQTLLEDFHVDEALSMLTPLYERFRTNPDVRGLFLLALVETDPDQALKLTETMHFDDLDKFLAQIESLVRKGRLSLAGDVLRQARLVFGEEDPSLLVRDAELSIEEYYLTKRMHFLNYARDCIAQLPQELNDPYGLVVKAYLSFTDGAKDALDFIAEVLREKKLPPFYLLRLRNRIGLASAGLVPSASAATSEPPNRDEKAALPTNKLPVAVAEVLAADMQALEAGLLRGRSSSDYVESVAETHLATWRDAADLGIPEGQVLLGIALRDGLAVEEDPKQAFSLIKDAAEKGLAVAMCNLGVMYENGAVVGQDKIEAVKWFRMAAERGQAVAQRKLCQMYMFGVGVEQSEVEAAKWCQIAAKQGYVWAQSNLGSMYKYGTGVEQNDVEAVKWYRKTAELGDDFGQYSLGLMYQEGRGVEKDAAEAVVWFRKAAEQGYAEAQFSLAQALIGGSEKNGVEPFDWLIKAANQGHKEAMLQMAAILNQAGIDERDGTNGVAKDDASAARKFQRAAELGSPNAQVNLGWMYDKGRGVTQNYPEAVKWYKMAADQGHALGQENLGIMYENGTGVTKDITEALKWYKLAADQGNDLAKNNLQRLAGKQHCQNGLALLDGTGGTKDASLAFAEFRKAADLGNAEGLTNLGTSYALGNGVVQDYNEAARWYRKAAEMGIAHAQYCLGRMHEYGHGVQIDFMEAREWYKAAAAQGHELAKENLDRVNAIILKTSIDNLCNIAINLPDAAGGWFYIVDGQEKLGPVSFEDLQGKLQRQEISGNTLVWHEGLSNWSDLKHATGNIGTLRIIQPPAADIKPSTAKIIRPINLPISKKRKYWYYSLDGTKKLGPISTEELQEKFDSQEFPETALVWQEGMEHWLPANQI